jgi:hypothetical protein
MQENLNPHSLDEPIWGAANIGREINRNERQVFWLLERKLIDATKVGNQWQSTGRRLRRSLGVEV